MPAVTKLRTTSRRLRRGVIRARMSIGPSGSRGPRVLVTSLPKSGTHLLSAVLAEFPELAKFPGNRIDPPPPWSWLPGGDETVMLGVGHPRTTDRARLRRFLGAVHGGTFLTGHVPHSPELAEDLAGLDYRLIAMVRDPRAVVVSKVRFANSLPEGRRDREHLRRVSPQEQIDLAIEGYALDSKDEGFDIGRRLDKILAWEAAGALVVRYEDLVGPRGGGGEEDQLACIRRIRHHLGLPERPEVEQQAATNSYGRSPTFRKGSAKGWQDHLSVEQAARIEELAGPAMHRLGYLTRAESESEA